MTTGEPTEPRLTDTGVIDKTSDDDQTELSLQNAEIDRQAKVALAEKTERLTSLELPSSNSYALNQVRARINAAIQRTFATDVTLELDRPSIKGKKAASGTDLSINIIPLVRRLGGDTQLIASQVAQLVIDDELVKNVEVSGPFINIEIDVAKASTQIFSQVTTQNEHYGWFRDGDPDVVVIDYSSPNIAKNLTVAHLRSTIIGQSLMNLQEASGNIPFGVNHIGDWGTHFGNIIYQYQQELSERGSEFTDELTADPAKTLMTIYRKFNDQTKNGSEEERERLLDEGRKAFLELEQGNPEYVHLWQQFRDWSLADFYPIYQRLNGVEFDTIQGESFYEDRMAAAVQEGLDQGALERREDGSVVFPSQVVVDPATMKENSQIMLTKDGDARDEIIIKPSGGTVYLTRDLAAILYRTRELGAKKILYVIGKEQSGHCIELFNMVHRMGAVALGDAQHVSFGHLNVDGRKMSSRSGKIILLDQLLDDARDAAAIFMQEQGRDTDSLADDLTEQIGISATIFNDLRQDRTKDIEFDPETDVPNMLKNGGAIYIQYTYARLRSILAKALEQTTMEQEYKDGAEPYTDNVHQSEKNILILISKFPQIVREAADNNAPHRIATYLNELCQELNSFQGNSELRVIHAANDARAFRLALVEAAAQVINNASRLLHMQLPDRM